MPSVSRVASHALVALVMLVVHCRSANAQASKQESLQVLEIDSEDADDQAEALTGALRSHVRTAPGWALSETTQSLRMLTAALRCPPHPDPACLQRIGDQIKADRFLWGFLTKSGGRQVTADVHLWARGKPDVALKETYSDNVKEQNDDTLRKIATRIFDRLVVGPTGTIVVHAGTEGGTVAIDGERKGTLDHGVALVVTSAGAHTIEVSAPGFAAARQNAVVVAGASTDVTVELTSEASSPPASEPTTPGSTRKTLAWTGVIGGGALLVAGGALGIVFEVNRSALNSDRQNNYGNVAQGATIQDPCSPPPGEANSTTSSGCNARNLAHAVIIPEIAALGAGGVLAIVGITLLATDRKHEAPSPLDALGLTELKLLPEFGMQGGSLKLFASF